MEIIDIEYLELVKNILSNQEFNKIKEIEHHGTTRYIHSLRVSYISYKITRLFHLDYKEVARAGLLHDFFISGEERTFKDRVLSTFTHPKYAIENSCKYFALSQKEKNIISSHMFPIHYSVPIYAESWIVSLTDKIVGTYEFCMKFKYKFSYITNLFLILLLNNLK